MVKMNGEILGKCVLRHRKYFAMDEYGESKKESKKNGDLEVGFFVFSPNGVPIVKKSIRPASIFRLKNP